jgi:hypothetical protein
VKVANAGILPLNRHRGPRIAFVDDILVISAVIGKTPSNEQHAHGLPSDGDLAAWRSTDGGKSWFPALVMNDVAGAPRNVLIYQPPEGTICECCASSATIARDGQIAVMWRNWLGGSRDLYLTQSRDGVPTESARSTI